MLNRNTNVIDYRYSLMPKGGELRMDDTENSSYSVRAALTYADYLDKQKKQRLTVSLTGDVRSSSYEGFKITKRGYLHDRGMVFDPVISPDAKKDYTAYNTWLTTSPEALGERKGSLTNLAALIGVVSYVYDNAYILNFNVRMDASNKFGDRSDDKLLPIWSASARWNMHDNILKNVKWINSLALKLSYGFQGNMSAQDSPDLQVKRKGMDSFFGEYYSEVDKFPNPFLTWERTSNTNISFDFGLFGNKLRGTIGYWYRHTSDAFIKKSVSSINGMTQYTVNKGTLVNQGYDFSLNLDIINNTLNKISSFSDISAKSEQGFVWRFNPNFGAVFNQLMNKLMYRNKELQDELTFKNYLDGSALFDGKPIGTFYSYKYAGLNPKDGRPIFHNTNPTMMVDGVEVSRGDVYRDMNQYDVYMQVMAESGSREPFLQGGINNYVGWRNWGLTINIAYSIGSKIRLFKMYPNVKPGDESLVPGPETNMRGEFNNRWKKPGDEKITDVPGILNHTEFEMTLTPWWNTNLEANKFADNIWNMYDQSDLRVVSGDYLKLQSISLRYMIPAKFAKQVGIKAAYVSFTGANLYTFASKDLIGQDPTQSGTSAITNLSVRPMYTFQLNINF